MIAGINEILSENAPLVLLLGTGKIFPMIVDADVAAPYLATSLLRSSGTDVKVDTSGADFPVININVHTLNYDSLEEISEAVRTALDNITSVTDAGYTFTRIWFLSAQDRPDLYVTNPTYTRSIQFNVMVKR